MTDPHPPRYTDPALDRLGGLRHAFFTRHGGVSKGVYKSLNMGYGSGDSRESIAENRRRAMAAFDLPGTALNTVYQVHGTGVAVTDGNREPADAPRADAQVTDRPGIAIGVLTADCVPVLFAGQKPDGARIVGTAHAGWKGALAGVLGKTVAAMVNLGAVRGTIHAAVGPCIGRESYEVGPEFPAPFLAQDPANDRFFGPGRRDGHPMFDIAGYVEACLESLDIAGTGLIEADTCADADSFFSYRRKTLTGEADYGRILSAIAIEG